MVKHNGLAMVKYNGFGLTKRKARPPKQFQKSSWAPQIPNLRTDRSQGQPPCQDGFLSLRPALKVQGQNRKPKMNDSTAFERCSNRLPGFEATRVLLRNH